MPHAIRLNTKRLVISPMMAYFWLLRHKCVRGSDAALCASRHRAWTKERNSAPPSVHKVRVLTTVVIFNMLRKLQALCNALFSTDQMKKPWTQFCPCTGINMTNFRLALKEASLWVPVTNCFFAVRKLSALKIHSSICCLSPSTSRQCLD